MEYNKIKVIYPSGQIDYSSNVSETYRNAIKFIGLKKVRSLNFFRNSINIVSTIEECLSSKGGKKESVPQNGNLKALHICTQFSTHEKFKLLQKN